MVKEFARTLQTGMSCLLSDNFPHRDLKVSNVLIIVFFQFHLPHEKFRCQVADFESLVGVVGTDELLESSREFTY